MKFAVDARNLDWALRNVKPHASTDTTLTGITQLQIQVGADIRVDATDRYTVGQARIDREDEDFGEPGVFHIHSADLAVILPTLKGIRGNVAVTVHDDRVEFGSIRVNRPDAPFPAIDKLWPECLPDNAQEFGINASLAKKLAGYKPADKHDNGFSWQVYAGETGKPMILIRNESFRVLALGTRIPDRDHTAGVYSTW